MAAPRILILRAPGVNCDLETAHAFVVAGGKPQSVHFNQWLAEPHLSRQFQILCLPGGFSYGDDIAAGRILAAQLATHLAGQLAEFKSSGKLILGICNGFQILIQCGVLLEERSDNPASAPILTPRATLCRNDSAKFEDRWVYLSAEGDKCVFLRDIERLYLPVAHAEGKFVAQDDAQLDQLQSGGRLVLRYVSPNGEDVSYPANPNGSQAHVAGMCDETGRVFGLMPHPERYIDRTQHPRWTRGEGADPGDGLAIFQNAVRYFE